MGVTDIGMEVALHLGLRENNLRQIYYWMAMKERLCPI